MTADAGGIESCVSKKPSAALVNRQVGLMGEQWEVLGRAGWPSVGRYRSSAELILRWAVSLEVTSPAWMMERREASFVQRLLSQLSRFEQTSIKQTGNREHFTIAFVKSPHPWRRDVEGS